MNISDVVTMFQNAKGTLAIVFCVLWLADEIMGSIPSIQATNFYTLATALLSTLKGQFVPQAPTPAATPAVAATSNTAQPPSTTPST